MQRVSSRFRRHFRRHFRDVSPRLLSTSESRNRWSLELKLQAFLHFAETVSGYLQLGSLSVLQANDHSAAEPGTHLVHKMKNQQRRPVYAKKNRRIELLFQF